MRMCGDGSFFKQYMDFGFSRVHCFVGKKREISEQIYFRLNNFFKTKIAKWNLIMNINLTKKNIIIIMHTNQNCSENHNCSEISRFNARGKTQNTCIFEMCAICRSCIVYPYSLPCSSNSVQSYNVIAYSSNPCI